MIRRKRYDKIPLQANYYPIPSAIYIEDESRRLTVLSAQPLGGSSLANGEIEIMQDRRLSYDDERGLGQGVLDNIPVLHVFRLIVENISDTNENQRKTNPSGILTLPALKSSKSILHPLDKLVFTENEWIGVQDSYGAERSSLPEDFEIVSFRELYNYPITVHKHFPKNMDIINIGLIIHRKRLFQCEENLCSNGKVYYYMQVNNFEFLLFYSFQISLERIFEYNKNLQTVYNTSLTFLQTYGQLKDKEINLCPMDTQAFIVQYSTSIN